MDAIKKQASKLREQVAKQQQAVLKQFSGHFGHDSSLVDEAELQCHQKLQMLYTSTKATKHLQRDIVRSLEAFIAVSSKQMEIVKKLAEDCCKYGKEFQSPNFALAKASLEFGTSHKLMESGKETLLRTLGDEVFEPLRAMILSAPLDDARHLVYQYERIRRDVEAQTAEVVRRQLKSKEAGSTAEIDTKLQHAEAKLTELRATLAAIGKEATDAMVAVEKQQQQTTFERLLEMVDAEKAYHQNVTGILDNLRNEIILAKQQQQSIGQVAKKERVQSQAVNENSKSQPASESISANGQNHMLFIAEAVHHFDAQADGELSLSVGDYVVVRQVSPSGWSEGECKGKAGWFPSAYVEKRDKAPASKVIDPNLLT